MVEIVQQGITMDKKIMGQQGISTELRNSEKYIIVE